MDKSFNQRLLEQCEKTNNRLCIGLDVDPDKLPANIKGFQSIEDFVKDLIDSTIDFCPVYKPNLAFYERFGSKGIALLENLVKHIGERAITIADGKRGDIGNTSNHYADAMFNEFGFDSITISPYMGEDSINPFIQNRSKGAFVLCLTSNKSADNFQMIKNNETPLYECVAKKVQSLDKNDNLGLVIGATNNEQMLSIREKFKKLTWLIPGIGAQGGDLEASVKIGNKDGCLGIINVSRAIIYAGNGSINDIAQSALNYTQKIRSFL